MSFLFRFDFYNNNRNLPVFQRKCVEYTVPEVVTTLLGNISEEKVHNTQPVSVEHNCTFVVKLSCVANPSDLRADDCGAWRHQGVWKTWAVIDDKGSIISQSQKCAPNQQDVPANGHFYALTRVHHTLQASEISTG